MRPSNCVCSEGCRCSTCVSLTLPPSSTSLAGRGCCGRKPAARKMPPLPTAYSKRPTIFPATICWRRSISNGRYATCRTSRGQSPVNICSTRDPSRSCASRARTSWPAISIAPCAMPRGLWRKRFEWRIICGYLVSQMHGHGASARQGLEFNSIRIVEAQRRNAFAITKKQDALRLRSGKVSIDTDGSEPISPDGKAKSPLRSWWAGHGD